ncbi:TPA: hypothetical protein ACLBZ1_005611 [Bacillus cereus]
MKKKMLKGSCTALALSIGFTALSPAITSYAAEKEATQTQFEGKELDNIDYESLQYSFNKSLEEDGIDLNELSINGNIQYSVSPDGTIQYGVKTKAAKEAAKIMINKMKGIGEKAFNKTVEKLPLPSNAKQYLKYQTVMKALNIIYDFEGDITSALTTGLTKVGVPSYLSGVIARAVVTFLL